MKAILYLGAVLMAGASIYGFVDYKKSSHKLSNLYESKEVPIVSNDEIGNAAKEKVLEKTVAPAKKEIPLKSNNSSARSGFDSKAEIKITKPDQTPVYLEAIDIPMPLETATLKENDITKKIAVTGKKKVNYKMFSRGALDEKIMKKKLLIPENGKSEVKDK